MDCCTVLAHAKINWTLDITGRREDGYHLVDMLLQSIGLSDTVTVRKADGISVACSDPAVPCGPANLAWKAARLFLDEVPGTGYSIYIEKKIPMAAGMAGGSADAAAVLWACNRLAGEPLSTAALMALGLKLGADVPFCLTGGCMRAEGIGEILSPVETRKRYIVAVKVPGGVSTAAVYQSFDQIEKPISPRTELAVHALAGADDNALAEALGNVLEPVTFAMRPELPALLSELTEIGAAAARMSGSGPSVYGLFQSPGQAAEAAETLKKRHPSAAVIFTETCGHGLELLGES